MPLLLDDLKFDGAGWDQLSLAAAPQVSVDKSRPLVVDFSVVTDDPGQWLELSFEVDGVPSPGSSTCRRRISPAC